MANPPKSRGRPSNPHKIAFNAEKHSRINEFFQPLKSNALHHCCTNNNIQEIKHLLRCTENLVWLTQLNETRKYPLDIALENQFYDAAIAILFGVLGMNDTKLTQAILDKIKPHALNFRQNNLILSLIELYLTEYKIGLWQVDTINFPDRNIALGHRRKTYDKTEKLRLITEAIQLFQPGIPANFEQLESHYNQAVLSQKYYSAAYGSEDSDSEDERSFRTTNSDRAKRFRKATTYFDTEFWKQTKRSTERKAGLKDKLAQIPDGITPKAIDSIKDSFLKKLQERATLADIGAAASATQWVAMFRGNNFITGRWSAEARHEHYRTNKEGQPQFAEAILKEELNYDFYTGLNRDNNLYRRQELLKKLIELSQKMQDKYQTLRKPTFPIGKLAPPNKADLFLFNSRADQLQHEFSNGINDHLLDLKQSQPPEDQDKFLNNFNYALATSTRPYHALRYALALKDYYTDAFTASYNQDGSLLYSHVGEVIIILYEKTEFLKNRNINRVVKQNTHGQVPIGVRILPELETSFLYYIPGEKIVYHQPLKFPSFHKSYKPIYEIKYGLDEELYNHFQRLIKITSPETPERNSVVTLLKEWLCSFYEVLLLKIAASKAQELGGTLIYIDPDDNPTLIPDKNPKTHGDANQASRQTVQVLERIRHLLANSKKLHEAGLLTDEDYQAFTFHRNPELIKKLLLILSEKKTFLDMIRYGLETLTYDQAKDIIKKNLDTFA